MGDTLAKGFRDAQDENVIRMVLDICPFSQLPRLTVELFLANGN